MKKSYIMVFGAIIITLLMISSATALNITQFKNLKEKIKNQNSETEKERYIDPNIKLSKKDLPKLILIVKTIKDPKYKELTRKIILNIEKKGILNSNDLREILDELDMKNTEVFSGPIKGDARWCGYLHSFPGFFFDNWFGLCLWLSWSAAEFLPGDELEYWVGWQNHHITEDHNGCAFSFFGYRERDIRYENGYPKDYRNLINGVASLIIIDYDWL